MLLYEVILTVGCLCFVLFYALYMGNQYFDSDIELVLWQQQQKKKLQRKSFALCSRQHNRSHRSAVSFLEPVYTNLEAEWLFLLHATDGTHTPVLGTHMYDAFALICSPAETRARGLVHAPPPLSQGCLYTEMHLEAFSSALPACPLRSLCPPHQCYLALFYWQSSLLLVLLLSPHHAHTSRYARWVSLSWFVFKCVWSPCRPTVNTVLAVLCLKPPFKLTESRGTRLHPWIFLSLWTFLPSIRPLSRVMRLCVTTWPHQQPRSPGVGRDVGSACLHRLTSCRGHI